MTARTTEELCLFCFKRLQDPVQLSCGHDMCSACVGQAQRFTDAVNALSTQKTEDEDKGTWQPSVKCPLCGFETAVDACKPDYVLRAKLVREAAADGHPPRCGFCGEQATQLCPFCGALCEQHNAFLHIDGPLRAHPTDRLPAAPRQAAAAAAAAETAGGAADRKAESDMEKLPVCKEHGKQMELYCTRCNVLVCTHCVLIGAHKGHKCSSVMASLGSATEMIEQLTGDIRKNVEACDALLGGFELLEAGVEAEQREQRELLVAKAAEWQKLLDERSKQLVEQLDALYAEFHASVDRRKAALRTLRDQCVAYVDGVAAPGALPQSKLARYTLYRALAGLAGALEVVAATRVPKPGSKVCRVTCSPVALRLASVVGMFRLTTARMVYNINVDALADSRSVPSDIAAGTEASHDGSAFYDPHRRNIVAVSGNFDNCRTVTVTHMEDELTGTTTTHRDIIPFGSHGQYLVYDGADHAYFLQSEDGDNDRFGRLDLATMTFEELPRAPQSFEEFCSACIVGGMLYAQSSEDTMQFNIAESAWSTVPLHIERARLLPDPADDEHLYALCEGRSGLFHITRETWEQRLVATPPASFDLNQNGEAAIVLGADGLPILFTCLSNSWYAYRFDTNAWVRLSNWADAENGSAHLVLLPEGPTAYYHRDEDDHFTRVDLS